MERTTIKDIARLAGVAVSTVSRVINNHPDVGASTREKVLLIMREQGYVPNGNAKNLKIKSSDYIAVVIRGFQNLFLNSLVELLQKHIETAGYHFLVHYIDERENEIEAARFIVSEKKVCGIVFLGGDAEGYEKELEALAVPCVFSTTEICESADNVTSVSVNDRTSAEKAIDYLLQNGHTSIAVIGGALEGANSIGLRFRGAAETLSRNGIQFKNSNYIVSGFTMESAYDAMSSALADGLRCTALFAMSDTMAIGAMRAIAEFGLSVPGDISVVGFDGSDISRFTNPPLTTVRQPIEEIASESVRLLMRGISGEKNDHVLLESTLIRGNTVRNLNV